MPCFHPLKGFRSRELNPSGKRSIVFNPSQGYKDFPVTVPCNKCIGCRLEYSRKWAVRLMHESSLYENNCFVTLTYDDASLPPHGSLVLEDFQKFMKRLRKRFPKSKIKFFHAGEYGDQTGRPHYHAILFNLDFPDKEFHTVRNGEKVYTSKILEDLWKKGLCEVGSVTFKSAAYVARYITKKLTGEGTEIYYDVIDEDTGEVHSLKREYATMSRGEGIGYRWFEKFKKDLYPGDFALMDGKKVKVPKYYDQLLQMEDPLQFAKISAKRKVGAKKQEWNNTFERLEVREIIQEARVLRLKRNL